VDAPPSAVLDEIGQLLWVGFDDESPGARPPDALLSRIRNGAVGGVVLFARNIRDVEQVAALNAELHAAAPADRPLLVCVDQEGGRVQRVRAPATVWPPMLRLGERDDGSEAAAERARAVGRALGAELSALGFDVDFAPVLDVHTNPQNPVIGDRAFATTPEAVARLAGGFARGLLDSGVLACGKHFPGHGDTIHDSHLELPRVPHALDRIRTVELAPFRALIERDLVPMIMTAHVVFDAIDPELPATLSEKVLAGVLRGELGYRGVVVSDDLEMKAIADHFGGPDAALRALLAGCDVFLICHGAALQREVAEALARAAARQPEVRRRIAESAARVAALKRAHAERAGTRAGTRAAAGAGAAAGLPGGDLRSILGAPAHRALADSLR
jgi:beta-N-acetylhexosaminidase